MTGDDRPINLNRVRKARARAASKVAADANAVRFGRTKGAKARDRDDAARRDAALDARRREPSDDGSS